MKKLLVLLIVLVAVQAEAAVPLPPSRPALATDVKVKSSRDRTRENRYSQYGVRTAVERDTTQKVFLSIEVRNMSPKVLNGIKISYQFYELQFERSTGNRMVLTRGVGSGTERLVPSGKGELTIEQLKALEKKVVETESLETSHKSTQDMTKLIAQTRTTGKKFGGYIIEYFVGGSLVKRDASSANLLEAYLKALKGQQGSGALQMRVGR